MDRLNARKSLLNKSAGSSGDHPLPVLFPSSFQRRATGMGPWPVSVPPRSCSPAFPPSFLFFSILCSSVLPFSPHPFNLPSVETGPTFSSRCRPPIYPFALLPTTLPCLPTSPLQPRSPTRKINSLTPPLSQQRSQTETRLQVTVEKTVHHDVSDELAARRGQRSSRSEPGATPDSLDEISKTPPGGYVSLPSATITHAV